MAKVLVVANETHGGRALLDAVLDRHAQGDATFVVLAPQNRPHSGLVIYDESVRDHARNRAEATAAAIRDHGGEVRTDVGDPDPYNATIDAVRQYGIHEIIISTHPATRSGWLRRDLIDRVRDTTGLPVQHVVVDLQADHEADTSCHTLVVANQTVGGEPLFEALRRRAAESPHRFIVVVPQEGGNGIHTDEAKGRLQRLLDRLAREGIAASGGIGDPDPYAAIMNALQFYRVDDIVISTLPRMRSRWMRSDLIDRVGKATDTPVEHVVVDLDAAGAATVGSRAAAA